MNEPRNLDITLFPSTYTIESPLGVVTVQDVSVGEYADAQKAGTFDELIRSQMIVSLTRPDVDVAIPAAELSESELNELAIIVKADQEAKWVEFNDKMRESFERMTNSLASKTASPFAPLYDRLNQQVQTSLRALIPPISGFAQQGASKVTFREREREVKALESQIATAEVLEDIYEKMVETAQQGQQDHDLQRRIFAAVLVTLAVTILGVVTAVVIQLTRPS